MRLPLGVAALIIVGAYLFRSLVIRKGDLALDLPADLVVIGCAVVALVLVALARRGGEDDVGDAGDEIDDADREESAGER